MLQFLLNVGNVFLNLHILKFSHVSNTLLT